MKKHFFPWTLGVFLVLTPLLSISPVALFAVIANDTYDADSTTASLELRAYPRAVARGDFQHWGDFAMPEYNQSTIVVLSVITLRNVPLHPELFATQEITQIRAPPKNVPTV